MGSPIDGETIIPGSTPRALTVSMVVTSYSSPIAPAPGFDDPLAMLVACHRRIERELATLGRLQRHLPEHGCDDDARAAARAIIKYFDGAAPNHHADEEESLFPRLQAHAGPLIEDLEHDHYALAASWRRLRPLLAGISASVRANLSPKQVDDICEMYAAHISREELVLMPLATRLLDAEALRQIGQEMAARRGTRFGAGGAVPEAR
jgi:hemerythrin-like domain-containing protein